jgi:hypothetical protein
MLYRTPEQQAALERGCAARTLIHVEARDPETGLPSPAGFWNDVFDVDLGGRVYHAANVIDVGPLSAVGDGSIPSLQITLSGLAPSVLDLVNNETVGRAALEYHLAIYDEQRQAFVGDPFLMLTGWIDDVDPQRPPAGGQASAVLTCVSVSRALNFAGTGTRSDATQHERDPNDDFYTYTAAQPTLTVYFGQRGPTRT